MSNFVEIDENEAACFEAGQNKLKTAIKNLQEAKDDLMHIGCESLILALESDIEMAKKLIETITTYPPMIHNDNEDGSYRTGIICIAGGTTYWHTGSSYYVARDQDGGQELDLRDLPGFRALGERRSRQIALLHDGEWQQMAELNPSVAQAIALLQVQAEKLKWRQISEFLIEYHKEVDMKNKAVDILFENGMALSEIRTLLKD